MNAEALLAQYERIAEAPDAIARLRRFVLDLAVRGKLVPQDPADEPASELLKQIGLEKARLVRAGEIKAEKPLPPASSAELGFTLPHGWRAVRLSEVAACLDFRREPINATEREKRIDGKAVDQLYPYYGATQQQGWIDDFLFDDELVLLGEDGVPFLDALRPKAYLIRGKSWVNNHAHVFKGILVSNPFLVHALNVFDYTGRVVGATRSKLNQARAVDIPLPLPPLAEQHRIVAKVDELMALCDRLEAARTAREAKRDRLAAASLARLNTPDPETFPSDARFALDALPALTTRPNQIKHLRQTILNLAVRGKLVPQEASDGPPPTFDRAMPADMPLPFDVPTSWRWSRLSALGQLRGGGTPSKTRDDFWDGDIPWVSPKDMKVDYIEAAQLSITTAALDGSAVHLLPVGSVLFVVRGMILAHSFPVAVTRVPVTVNQDMKALVLKNPAMAEYLLRALKGLKPQMLARVQRSTHGTCRLEGSNYSDFVLPIPPLAEQHRIVAKVNELMSLCDALEASLAAATTARTRLLEATLAEALAPAEALVLEPA